MSSCVQYPAVGCVVEYFDANAMQIAIVLEEVSGKLRLMLPNRRETKLAANRVLPWISAPVQGFSSMSRDEMVKVLEEARARRAKICEEMDVISLWELAQGEVDKAQASFFAELLDSEPSVDAVAAIGHALLSCRTHFRFVPPNFEIYDAETVARREEEKKKQEERDRFINEAGPFVRLLLAVASHKAELPARDKWPCEDVQARLEEILRKQMVDPDSSTTLWQTLVKGLNDDPLLSVRLLLAWGKLEPHHNYWLDKAGYDPGDTWWQKQEEAARTLADNPEIAALEACDLPFVSIDGDSTEDIDDAFYIEGHEDGSMTLTLALACPALGWPFGSKFDSLVRYRGTSVYLPEGDYHMLPRFLGTDALSLFAGKDRPALVFRQDIAKDGSVRELCSFEVRKVRLAANLRYAKCQEVLDGTASEDNPSLAYADMLKLAAKFSRKRKAYRISRGAVILDKREPQILLFGEGEDVKVELCPGKPSCEAQDMVAEMMILASASAAEWAVEKRVPFVFRTQSADIPPEYAGIWNDPVRMTEIMHCMVPSILETQPRMHAALGLSCYAPMTSPLRRYADLVNEAQILSFLACGAPKFAAKELDDILLGLHIALDGAGQIQRFRPRYWKLLFFSQKGEDAWWHGVVTEENDTQYSVSLPDYDIFLRGRKKLFDERTVPGSRVVLRIGRVNPLYNEMQILEVLPEEAMPQTAEYMDGFGMDENTQTGEE